jgi:hypothetical protein
MKTNESPSTQLAEFPLAQCSEALKERLEKLKQAGTIEGFETVYRPKERDIRLPWRWVSSPGSMAAKLLMLQVTFKTLPTLQAFRSLNAQVREAIAIEKCGINSH